MLASWGNCCAVTGVTSPEVIRASHIKPWRDSDNAERLDPYNGLPLVATWDALFDAGLITFTASGDMRGSPMLPDEDRRKLAITGMR